MAIKGPELRIPGLFGLIVCFILHIQVDPLAKPYKNLQLYEILLELMRDEENVEFQIRNSEKEVLQFTRITTKRVSPLMRT